MRNCDWCGKLVADKSGYVLGYKVFCCKECYEKGRERQREEEEEEFILRIQLWRKLVDLLLF